MNPERKKQNFLNAEKVYQKIEERCVTCSADECRSAGILLIAKALDAQSHEAYAADKSLTIEEIAKLTRIELNRFERFNRLRELHRGGGSAYGFLLSFADDLLKTISDQAHELYFLTQDRDNWKAEAKAFEFMLNEAKGTQKESRQGG